MAMVEVAGRGARNDKVGEWVVLGEARHEHSWQGVCQDLETKEN